MKDGGMQRKTSIRCGVISVVLFGLSACLALACPIPVFQYALEYWEPNPYVVEARSSETWSADQRAALRLLQDAEREGRANLRVRTEPSETKADQAAGSALPRMEALYPDTGGVPRTLWSGEPSSDVARRLLHSPARVEIARMLLQRKSAVWVLLESGNRRKDNETARLLKKELRRLENTLTTPDPEAWGGSRPDRQAISFGILRLRRDDQAETMFVRMLLNSEPDLEKFGNEVMVFPIYGRGLILYALIGSGINPWTISEAAEFLTGPCACQIKEACHGTELLITVDWEGGQGEVKEKMPAAGGALVGTGGFLQRMEKDERRLNEPEPLSGKGNGKK